MQRIAAEKSLLFAALFAVLLLTVYHETAWSMVAIWSRSDTFAHGFLILPISGWLAWTHRARLRSVAPDPSFAPIVLMIPAAGAWLLAAMVGVSVVQQLAMVALLVLGAWAVMGHRLALVMAFPLMFLFFAVPMGEGLIPPMMEFTADSTVWMIQMSGIPVYREGLNFTLPSGAWSVVEACSGVRYIIASVTVGVLYAYLTYISWLRRITFVVVSFIVPIFANTLRAYIIVMLGHMSDMKIATGADHLVYGWAFFGIVIFALFWFGSFFREDDQMQTEEEALSLPVATRAAPTTRLLTTLGVALLVALLPPTLVATRLAPPAAEPLSIVTPEPAAGWASLRSAYWVWRPVAGVGGYQSVYFAHGGEPVALFIQYADGTVPDSDVIGTGRLMAKWHSGTLVAGTEQLQLDWPVGTADVDEVRLSGPDGQLLAWSWYRVGDVSTANDYRAKLQEVLARLAGDDSRGYRLVLATTMNDGVDAARERLSLFMADHSSAVYAGLSGATGAVQ
ncbi:MAG: exosortase A [Halioglobus sp.]|nr:exosortase A [Halioglobus sp.]